MKFNNAQSDAIFSRNPLIVVSAGAGSGKTRVLTERFVHICEIKLNTPQDPFAASANEIVALTFTEKAAREMKERIRERIDAKWRESSQEDKKLFWSKQLDLLDDANISTFHSFCQRLIREHAYEAKVYPDFSLMDDTQATLMQQKVLHKILEDPKHHAMWQEIYTFYTRALIRGAIPQIYNQIREYEAARNLTSFLDAENILYHQLKLVEEKRQEEIKHAEAAYASLAEKFYDASMNYLKRFPDPVTITRAIKVKENLANAIVYFSGQSSLDQILGRKSFFKELHTLFKGVATEACKKHAEALYLLITQEWDPIKDEVKRLEETLNRLQSEEFSEADLAAFHTIITIFCNMLYTFDHYYTKEKRNANVLDFADLQHKAIALLEHETTRSYCQKRYKHVMIDEFQDTNPLQFSLLSRLDPAYRFIVGDGKQSIYRFRGADVSLIKTVSQTAAASDYGDFIEMNTNYRTCESILQLVNLLFGRMMEDSANIALESNRKENLEKIPRVELLLVEKEEKEKEYDGIAQRILQMVHEKKEVYDTNAKAWRPANWGDIAILLSSRTNLLQVEKAFKHANIPYTVHGGIGFYQRQEVQEMILLLQWMNRPSEEASIIALLRGPLFGLSLEELIQVKQARGDIPLAEYIYQGHFFSAHVLSALVKEKLAKLKTYFEKFVPFAPSQPIKEALKQIFVETGLEMALYLQSNNLQLVRNVEKLIDILSGLSTYSLEDMLRTLQILQDISNREGEAEVEITEENRVHILTVHASKGLEFPIVFVPNLAKGSRSDTSRIRFHPKGKIVLNFEMENDQDPLGPPIKKASPFFDYVMEEVNKQEMEEGKRLFYVALTRARDYLVLSSCDNPKKNTWYKQFVDILEAEPSLLEYLTIHRGVPEGILPAKIDEEVVYPGPMIYQAREIPVTFSVTEILSYLKDPIQYYYTYILKLDSHWLQAGKSPLEAILDEADLEEAEIHRSATTLGTIVHRACERMDQGYTMEQALMEAYDLLTEVEQVAMYRSEVDYLVGNYAKLRSILGTSIENEWEFTLELEGIWIKGEIDKVFAKDGEIHILDLKTNSTENILELIEIYKPQLYLYKMAYEQKSKNRVDRMSLFFLPAEEHGLQSLVYEAEYEEKLKRIIRHMAELKKRKAPKTEYYC